jgi:hypothetical protein
VQLNRELRVGFAIVLTMILSPVAKAQSAGCDRLWVAGGELWRETGNQFEFLLSDPDDVLMPRWSSRRDLIAYTHAIGFDGSARSEVVVVDGSGRRIRSLEIDPDSAVNAVLQLGWRDAEHVFIEGHVNPSTTKYLEWEVASGRLVDEKAGSWFTVSTDGQFVAQRAHVPHGAPPPYDSATLVINDRVVYPAAADDTYHRFASRFAWSDDGSRLAMIDITGETAELVVVTPADASVTRAPFAALDGSAELSWSGAGTVVIQTDSGESWQADVASGRVTPAAPSPVSSLETPQPKVLRDRLRNLPARVEDTRCSQRNLQ